MPSAHTTGSSKAGGEIELESGRLVTMGGAKSDVVYRTRAASASHYRRRHFTNSSIHRPPGLRRRCLAWEDKDPDRIVMIVRFKDRESYMANADRPETDTDYRKQLEYLDGEPEWIDVSYADYVGKPLGG
jgi:hypothetical protein